MVSVRCLGDHSGLERHPNWNCFETRNSHGNSNIKSADFDQAKNRLNTLAVIRDTFSSTRIELGQAIEPAEKTAPPPLVS